MSIVLNIEPPIQGVQQYTSVHSRVNQILNDKRFGNSSARLTPRLDQIERNIPVDRMWIITRDKYIFSEENISLLFELIKEANIPYALTFAFQVEN